MTNSTDINSCAMAFTGERYVPELHGTIEIEHLHRYVGACNLAAGKVVLDIASGEGYGSAMLADKAARVIGVDISIAAIDHARKRYKKENLEFRVGSCANIPLPDASVDMVISFETIEHHDQHERMMQEVKRVLRKTGILLISSPDKTNYNYLYSVKPGCSNPYHIKELTRQEFAHLLESHFKNIAYFGQRIVYGSSILKESPVSPVLNYWQDNENIRESSGITKPTYWIALASDFQLPQLSSSFFEKPDNDSEIAQYWRTIVEERDSQIAGMSRLVAARDSQITSLSETLAELNSQLADRDFLITSITSSSSWKITRPLRFVSEIIRGKFREFFSR